MVIPSNIYKERDRIREELIHTEEGRIYFELGFDECAKLMLTEARRLNKLYYDLLREMSDMKIEMKRRESE